MSKKAPPIPSTLPTLSASISELRVLLEAIECLTETAPEGGKEADEILDAIAPRWDRAMDNFRAKVDARIGLLDYLDLFEAKVSSDIAALSARKKAAATIAQRIKDQTKMFMEENRDLEFRGSIKSFALQANGGNQAIEYRFDLQTLTAIVDPTDVCLLPEGYVRSLQVFQLDKARLDADVRAGKVEPNDALNLLPRGEHLRRR